MRGGTFACYGHGLTVTKAARPDSRGRRRPRGGFCGKITEVGGEGVAMRLASPFPENEVPLWPVRHIPPHPCRARRQRSGRAVPSWSQLRLLCDALPQRFPAACQRPSDAGCVGRGKASLPGCGRGLGFDLQRDRLLRRACNAVSRVPDRGWAGLREGVEEWIGQSSGPRSSGPSVPARGRSREQRHLA